MPVQKAAGLSEGNPCRYNVVSQRIGQFLFNVTQYPRTVSLNTAKVIRVEYRPMLQAP
jgi:hypothetical protein